MCTHACMHTHTCYSLAHRWDKTTFCVKNVYFRCCKRVLVKLQYMHGYLKSVTWSGRESFTADTEDIGGITRNLNSFLYIASWYKLQSWCCLSYPSYFHSDNCPGLVHRVYVLCLSAKQTQSKAVSKRFSQRWSKVFNFTSCRGNRNDKSPRFYKNPLCFKSTLSFILG